MPRLRLLGPFPPPFGGVALHLVRLLEECVKRGVDVSGVTLGGVPDGLDNVRKFRIRDVFDRTRVHYHTDEGNYKWMILFSLWWRMLGIPYAVTVHSFRHRDEFELKSVKHRLQNAYNGAQVIVAISQKVRDELVTRIGVDESLITILPSALPLSHWEKMTPMPVGIPEAWIKAPVRVIFNAGRLVRYNGKDLYGLDLVVEAFQKLGRDDIHCLVVIGDVIDEVLFNELSVEIRNTNNVYVVKGLHQVLTPLVNHAHIVIRATRTEGGESLTLTEALELGKWAVGSDAVHRPTGTILFSNENAKDLARAVVECADQTLYGRFPAPYITNVDAANAIIEAVLSASALNRR